MIAPPLLLTLLLLGSNSESASFLLHSGGEIHGRLLNPDESPRAMYEISLESGGVLALGADQVARVSTVSEDLQWYRAWSPKVPPTVEGHWKMAEECRARSLDKQREEHLREVIKLDPDHAEARSALGYGKVDGRWLKTDEWMRGQGYIRYRGAWRLPQDAALERTAEETERTVKLWRQKLKRWLDAAKGPRGRLDEAIGGIRAIQDPHAVPALVDLLDDEQSPRDLRLLSVEVLTTLPSYLVVPSLVGRAMQDRDPLVRDACLDGLGRLASPLTLQQLKKELKSANNDLVNRAAYCLGQLQAEDATLDLINALVTEHRFVIQSGGNPGQYNLGFGSGPGGGGSGFSAGGRPKVVTTPLKNQGVLNALVSLHPGTSFGYDEAAWKSWFVDQHREVDVELRRDP